jgi:hypothetical protein
VPEEDPEWQAWLVRRKQYRLAAARQRRQDERDEKREIVAQAKYCLIEAYEDMRDHPDLPYVPPEPTHVAS